MTVDPFPRDLSRPLVVHVRTHVLSDRKAPFLLKTILGLTPYFRNVVITPGIDCVVPADLHVECVQLKTLRDPIARLEVVRRLRETYGAPDLVIGHMGNGARIGAPLAELMDVPIMGIFGGSDVNVEFDKPTYRDVYRELTSTACTRFLTVADYLRQKLVDKGVAPDRLFAWHRGTDLSLAQPAEHAPQRDDRSLQVAIVGRFLEVKGHVDLVRALGLLRDGGVDVVVNFFGDGPLRGQLEALAEKLGVRDAVRFHGHVKHSTVIEQMAKQDVYVHPSVTCSEGRTEGVPNAIMEAHAAGLPVVATRSGGIPEVVLDGETGFLVDEHDPAGLAEKLGILAGDQRQRVSMGARGRAHVEAEFSLRTQSRRLAAHATHLIRQGQLFGLRGWRKHAVAGGNAAEEGLDLQARLVSAAGRARYASSIPVVGRLIDYARKIAYTSLVKPYLRAFAGELKGFISERQPTLPSEASAAAPAIADAVQLMSQAACSECPHCPLDAPWPATPCAMDDGCRAALAAEFQRRAVRREGAALRRGVCVDVQQLRSGGALPFADGSQREASVRAELAEIEDLDHLMSELARVLQAGGEVIIDLSWLGRAHQGVVPFERQLFGAGADSRSPDDLVAWDGQGKTEAVLQAAARVGLRRSISTDAMRQQQQSCPVDFQARFAPALQRFGATYEQAAVAICCALVKTDAGTD